MYNFDKIYDVVLNTESSLPLTRRLFHLRVELTEVCNFQCKFCVTQEPALKAQLIENGYEALSRRAKLENVNQLLDEAKRLGVRAISFTSVGDPLMYPFCQAVFDRAAHLEFKLGLTSNFAMKLKPKLLSRLASFDW